MFTEVYANPSSKGADAVRGNLREALRLMQEAGYELKGNKLVSKATGEPLRDLRRGQRDEPE